MLNRIPLTLLLLVLLCSAAVAGDPRLNNRPQVPGVSPNGISAMPWDKIPAKFIMSMTTDHAGRIWVGTEDDGVFVYDPKTDQTTQFTTQNGLAENFGYAIACDSLGRIWVGHQTRGVSVYNGQRWQNYEVVGGLSDKNTLSGPLGERVFKIAVSPPGAPNAGDVWIGTNLGLSRYSPTTDTWSYFTRAEGLASDQIDAIAVDDKGTIYAGTACDGLCIASAKDGYKKWRNVGGPLRPTLTPAGSGLPSALINDILAAKDGSIWVATNFGIGISRNRGQTWSYVRGADWAEKVKGLYGGPPKGWKPIDAPTLLEDYTTCIAEDVSGHVWMGHRQTPWEVYDSKTGGYIARGAASQIDQSDKNLKVLAQECFIDCLLPLSNGGFAVGSYGGGIFKVFQIGDGREQITDTIENKFRNTLPKNSITQNSIVLGFPSAAKPVSLSSLGAQIETAKLPSQTPHPGDAFILNDDWTTKGNWVGKYGFQSSTLCAADSPFDHNIAYGEGYDVKSDIGPHANSNDGLRHWVHWAMSDNENVLWDPCVGHRRQAEWDDHGEAYSMMQSGPDIWIAVAIPPGAHRLALYFFNKDGHYGKNRYRDFLIEIKQWGTSHDIIESTQPIAVGRVNSFWGGEYKQFSLMGPAKYAIKINRNYSFNTLLSGVFIDKIIPEFTGLNKQLYNMPTPWMGHIVVKRPAADQSEPGYTFLDSVKPLGTENAKQFEIRLKVARLGLRALGNTSPLCGKALRWQANLANFVDQGEFARVVREGFDSDQALKAEQLEIRRKIAISESSHLK